MESPLTLPYKFVLELTTLVARIVSELAIVHSITPTPENIYETGKQVIAIGLSLCAASKHADADTTIKDITNMNSTISESVRSLQDRLDALPKVVDKNVN